MKLFSILNKPAVRTNNKQAGLVFLEYVIMAFIVTVAVICALWWFYWHLQQMTWEVKQKLDTLKTLTCELGKPGGPESVQPTPFYQKTYNFTAGYVYSVTDDVPFPKQKVVIQNTGETTISFSVYFVFYIDGVPNYDPDSGGLMEFTLGSGEKTEPPLEYNHEAHGYPGPYALWIIAIDDGSNTPYSVTVSQLP